MTTNSKLTIEQKIIDFVYKLLEKQIIKSDGVVSRRIIKDRYHLDLKRKPFMESMKFKRFLEIIKKYDFIMDDKVEGKLQFKIDSIKQSKADMETKLNKTDKTKNKKIDKEVILSSPDSIELAYVTTFRQHMKTVKPTTKFFCPICKLKFNTDAEFVVHFNEHGKLFMIRPLKSTSKIERMFGVSLEITKTNLNLKLKNNTEQLLNITDIFLYNSTTLMLITGGSSKKVMALETWTIPIRNALLSIPNLKYSVIIKSENTTFEFVEQYHITMKRTGSKMLKKTDTTRIPLKFEELADFPVSGAIQKLYNAGFDEKSGDFNKEEKTLLDHIQKYIAEKLMTNENYVSVLNIMNQIEDYDLINTYKNYACEDVKLTPCHQNRFYVLKSSDFWLEPTQLKQDDKLVVTVELPKGPDRLITGRVYCIIKGDVIIQTDEDVPENKPVLVEFIRNRFTFYLEYQALLMVRNQKISDLFFPELPPKIKLPENLQFNWFNRDINKNLEQRTAVQNIVNDSAFPAPYILFGPPGTGKTSTLVEAICQIYSLKPNAKILVTAETNYACNEVANRLLKYLSQKDIFRFFSRSSDKLSKELDWELLSCSNFNKRSYRIPYYDEIYENRIIICTLSTSGRLVQAGIKPNFFDYVIIDECGSAKEVSSLIPLAGLAVSDGKLHAKIILAGDPKQLGPVVCDRTAQSMGQNISMLERLMEGNPIYKKDPETKKYNNQLITKLLKNYRSHEAILQFSNDNFYDGELETMAKTEITDWALNWSKLPNKDFPIIFHYVYGKTIRDRHSASLHNKLERRMVKIYLTELLTEGINGKTVSQTDIGVISPYAMQVRSIKDMCYNAGWKDIQIGTTEQFQGREKKIIIISTVRSKMQSMGFLSNTKRLNVAITRAQSLLIVIGNPKTLHKSFHWKQFIDYCVENMAIRGLKEQEVPEDTNVAELEEETENEATPVKLTDNVAEEILKNLSDGIKDISLE